MTDAIVKHEEQGAALAVADFTQKQREIIKSVLCPGISDEQLDLFGQVCKRTGLDPFAKQIYATLRNAKENVNGQWVWVKKLTIQVGIDGFRLIAERTKKYAGQGDFEWFDGERWTDVPIEGAVCARATVFRSDFSQPIRRIARYGAYVQTDKEGKTTGMWSKMAPEQLAKCAEALALRTAFPQELSGIYATEEMEQADSEPREQQPRRIAAKVIDAPAELPAETERKSEPPPAAAEGPRFPVKWSAEYGGRLMSEVPIAVLSDYIGDLEQKLFADELTERARAAVQASLDAAKAIYEQQLSEEQLKAGYTQEAKDAVAALKKAERDAKVEAGLKAVWDAKGERVDDGGWVSEGAP